jgi:hypothetical protein
MAKFMLRMLCTTVLVAASLTAAGKGAEPPIRLRDVTGQTLTFRHDDGGRGAFYLMETVSAGLALFDYDNDGDQDVYFLNGAPIGRSPARPAPRNALFRNEGNWRFTDVTALAGVGDDGHGLGVAVGDYDGDGDQDLYLNNYGPNVLYRNNGDGTFSDVTRAAGVGNGNLFGAGASFLDMDGDGDLDLYAANYLKFSSDAHAVDDSHGVPFYASPGRYDPEPDTLFRNNGDGTFTDVTQASGIGKHAGWGMGIVSVDYDNDGDTDVFIANDMAENFLFRNDGRGNFSEVGLLSGIALDLNGYPHGSMGVACGDFDNDGWLDFHVTSYQRQLATLYRSLEGQFFLDVTRTSGAGAGTYPLVTWGNGFVDFDNDGDRDLFVAGGHLQVNVEQADSSARYCVENLLYANTGSGNFVNVSDQAGDGLAVKLSSRGTAYDDLDQDGDMDVVILNSRREATILRNDTELVNHWLQVRLRGTKSNRDGIGSHVRVTAGGRTQLDEVHSGRGYQSHHGLRLHFGLGDCDRVDRIEVRWLGGGTQVLEDVEANQCVVVVEEG